MRRRRSIILILSSIVLCFYFHVKNKSIHDELNAGSTFSNPFKIVSNSSPYNKYAYLTARDLYAKHRYVHRGVDNIRWDIGDKSRVTEQLNSGVRALILKIQSDGNGARDVSIGQRSTDWDNDRYWWDSYTPALELLEEIERFLYSNPFEILTLILEDCVGASNGLAKVFEAARLTKYLFPLKKMPRNGGDWPSVKDMAAANQRLIVFTSNISKEESEGIAHTWNFMVECKYSHGNYKRAQPSCIRREYKPVTDDTSKSLVLLNYYSSPKLNEDLMNAIHACHGAASNRWANFIAIHYDKDFGTRQAIDHVNYLNGKFLCGSDDVKSCKGGTLGSSMKAVFTFLCWVWIFVLLICCISR